MSRDKQIEEMAKAVCHLDRTCDECMTSFECKAMMYAKRFYEAGYRKVDDIFEDIFEGRLEVVNKKSGDKLKKASDVAEEIFAEIEKILNRIYNTYVFEDNDYSDDDVAIECAVNYGTEVAINIAELKKKYIGKDTNVTTNTEE